MDDSSSEVPIRIITEPIRRIEAGEFGKVWYVDLVKGVADIDVGVLALGGEYHMDANVVLLEQGSSQKNIWGFNIYPERTDDSWIEFISLINIRPAAGNRTMEVEDERIRAQMRALIEKLII